MKEHERIARESELSEIAADDIAPVSKTKWS
jgi:hypothetical protein